MNDLESTQTNTIEQPQAGAAQVASVPSDVMKRLEILEMNSKRANDEAAKARIEKKEVAEQKAALEAQLNELKPKAERYDAYVAKQLEAVNAEVAALPPLLQKAVSALPLEEKAAWLQEHKAGQAIPAQPAPAKAPPMAGAPAIPPSKKPTVQELMQTGLSLHQVQQMHPDVWAEEMQTSAKKPLFRI